MLDFSSPTRDWTCILCIARQILNHWTLREVPCNFSFKCFMGEDIVKILRMNLAACSHGWGSSVDVSFILISLLVYINEGFQPKTSACQEWICPHTYPLTFRAYLETDKEGNKQLQRRVIRRWRKALGQLHWSKGEVILWFVHHTPAVLPSLAGYSS